MSLQNAFLLVMTALFAVPLFAVPQSLSADDASKGSPAVVYELRTYTAFPGKLDDLHKRFRDHTMRLFEKHGMKNVGYWVPIDTPDTLVYIIAHKSRQAAEQSWKEFRADPEWKQVAKESERNGRIVKKFVSQYLSPTDYSPIK